MSVPERVQSSLGDENVAAQVSLGGEDVLYVTPTRTLIYRAEGLLSDESVDEYPHDAECVEVSEGRRKSKITLDYGLDGERIFVVPTKRLREALHPVLAGVLNAVGITDPGERVSQTFRFSELTVVVTSARVVKHIGGPVWDEDYEEFHYDDVTDLTFETGSVATSIVIAMGDRQERFKAPNEDSRALREALESALLAHYDVDTMDAFRAAATPDEEEEAGAPAGGSVDFGEGVAPLSANPSELSGTPANATRTESTPEQSTTTATTDASVSTPTAGGAVETAEATQAADATTRSSTNESAGFEGSGFESARSGDASDANASDADDEVSERLREVERLLDEQNRELREQRELIERLIAELRRGR